jgi:hypothetical protein
VISSITIRFFGNHPQEDLARFEYWTTSRIVKKIVILLLFSDLQKQVFLI